MTASSKYERWREILFLCVLSAVGFALRFYRIHDRGFWKDESEFFFTCFSNFHLRQNAPLAVIVHRVAMDMMGSADSFTLRLPSLVFGTVLIPAVFIIGRLLAGRAVAWLAAGLTVLSPMALYYSQEGRPYAMYQFISALVLITFLKAYSSNKIGWWASYAVAMALAGMTHMLTIQLAAGLAVFMLAAARTSVDDHRFSRLLTFTLATGIGLAVGLSWIFPRHRAVTAVLNGPYKFSVLIFLETVVASLGPYFVSWRLPLTIGWFVASVGVFLFAVVGAVRNVGARARPFVLLAPSLFVSSLLIDWYTLGAKSLWVWPRYLSHLLPIYLILIAAGVDSVCRTERQRMIAAASIVVLFLFGTADWARALTWDRAWKVTYDSKLVSAAAPSINGVMLVEVSAPDYMVTTVWGLYYHGALPAYFMNKRGTIFDTHWIALTPPAPPMLLTDKGDAAIPDGRYAVIDTDSGLVAPGCEAFQVATRYNCEEDSLMSGTSGLRIVQLTHKASL